jgi:hypothetical protein
MIFAAVGPWESALRWSSDLRPRLTYSTLLRNSACERREKKAPLKSKRGEHVDARASTKTRPPEDASESMGRGKGGDEDKIRRGVEGQSRSPHNRRGMRGKRDGAPHSEWTAAAAMRTEKQEPSHAVMVV